MDRNIMLLAERLVIAVEMISQDMKNMSTYVYDISCSLSCLLSEKRGKQYMPAEAQDESSNPPSGTSVAGLEASAEKEYTWQYEEVDKRASSLIGDLEHQEGSCGDAASASNDAHENSDFLSSESKPTLTDGIKLEDQSEDDEYGNSRNVDGPSDLLETIEHASTLERQDIRGIESECNSAVNSEYVTHMELSPGGQPETRPRQRAKDSLMAVERRSYHCFVCEKSFRDRYDLERHKRVHTGERPFICRVCGKGFTDSCALNNHMRIHTGERPFSCSDCGRAFSRRQHLILHRPTHTGERPYKCNVCEKAYARKATLRDHMLIHTGEKPYKCALCGREFRHHSTLTQHMYTHSAEPPVQ